VLALVAAWCLFSQYIHIHWLVTPGSTEPGFAWSDLVALVAVLCLTTSFCLWLQRGKSLTPFNDPRYGASLEYESR
jgi:hypothetical protein